MRGTVAKRLRNAARKISKPTTAKVKWYKKWIPGKYDDNGSPITVDKQTVFYAGYRRIYQDMKRAYMRTAA